MSLINDALKRARQSQQNSPPSGALPLPPVEPPARNGSGSGWMLGLAAILFLAAAGLFITTALFKRPAQPVATAKAPEVFAPPSKPAQPAPAPVANPLTAASPIPVSTPASNALPVMAPAKAPPPAPVEQLPKVQGIIFSATHPVAIVNGKTVGVGDDVGNFRVKQILKASIVFQRPDGSQKTLNLGE